MYIFRYFYTNFYIFVYFVWFIFVIGNVFIGCYGLYGFLYTYLLSLHTLLHFSHLYFATCIFVYFRICIF